MVLREKLIEHITKEIELITNNMAGFRTKSAFTIWIGPYVLLGSVILATEGSFTITKSLMNIIAVVVVCVFYLALGVIAGMIERGAWRRCNTLRKSILELCQDGDQESLGLRLCDYQMEKFVLSSYFIVFLIIEITFGAIFYLALGIQSQ